MHRIRWINCITLLDLLIKKKIYYLKFLIEAFLNFQMKRSKVKQKLSSRHMHFRVNFNKQKNLQSQLLYLNCIISATLLCKYRYGRLINPLNVKLNCCLRSLHAVISSLMKKIQLKLSRNHSNSVS